MAHYDRMINNSFYESKNNFRLIKRESSNRKKTYGRCKRWVLVENILQKCLVQRSFWQVNVIWNWFVFVSVVGDQRYVSRKCIRRKIGKNLWPDWYWYGLSARFFKLQDMKLMHLYLEPFQRYMIELFCENS